jgi:hypothetical protein
VLARVAVLSIALATLLPRQALSAPQLTILGRFTREAGLVADGTVFGDGKVALAYPELGRIALYEPDGTLDRHIMREGGQKLRFEPTTMLAAKADTVLVFDEADHKLFTIFEDGNVSKGVDLAYTAVDGDPPLALSRIGDLCSDGADRIWVNLPDRGVLARFSPDGKVEERRLLATELPYSGGAVFTRPQFTAGGSFFLLDYHEGVLLYRFGGASFKRIRAPNLTQAVGRPTIQDFAVDDSGNVLMATAEGGGTLVYLARGTGGYTAHPIRINLPAGPHRIALRQAHGKFLVWLRDDPSVFVLQLR